MLIYWFNSFVFKSLEHLFILLITYLRGKKIYEPPRYMSVSQAAEQLVEVVKNKKEEGLKNLGKLKLV